MNSNKAAPYPDTDYQENEAIHLFKTKIDRKYIKTQINSREKIPNVDGYIEIVNEDNVPVYKFEIQIKTIKNKQKSYYCHLETVYYTNVTTLPILLILADITQEKVYWKHLISTNARQSPKKKSYIFDLSDLDLIDQENNYLIKWKAIAENYIDKIKSLVDDNKLIPINKKTCPPINLSKDAITYFQKYIDKVNSLLDNDYNIVKQIYFTKYWKLGVSICKFGTYVSFGIFGIPHGESIPLINEVEDNGEKWIFSKGFLKSFYFSKTDDNPEKKAIDFVLQFAKKIFHNKLLLPVGKRMAEEYVYYVISKCYYMFGLKKSNTYIVDEIATGINKHLNLWVSIALDYIDYTEISLFYKEENTVDILYLADIFYFFPDRFPDKYKVINNDFNMVISGQKNHKINENIKLFSNKFDLFIFINCINYLKQNNIKTVEAYLPEPNYELIKNKKIFMQLDLYLPKDRKKYLERFYNSIKSITDEFVEYYKLPEEYKLYSNEKYHYFIIPEVIKRSFNDSYMENAEYTIIVTECHENDKSNVTVVKNKKYFNISNLKEIWEKGFIFNGKTYKVISWSSGLDDCVFHNLPFYNRVYSHLLNVVEKKEKKIQV